LVVISRSNKKEDSQTVIAVYENGVFRLMRELEVPLQEGQRVRLTVEKLLSPDEIIELAAHVYAGFSEEEIAEIEKIMLDRSNFFPERDWSWLDDEDIEQDT
jgi:predicted DNA-binding antitoxin AbrB/MazE fold protein